MTSLAGNGGVDADSCVLKRGEEFVRGIDAREVWRVEELIDVLALVVSSGMGCTSS
jgi:hypothetical protein